MTNKEALIEEVGYPVSDNLIKKVLMKTGLNEGAEYINANESLIDQAAIRILRIIKKLKSITEGGFTITIDAAAVNEQILFLSGKSEAPKPTISNASHLW